MFLNFKIFCFTFTSHVGAFCPHMCLCTTCFCSSQGNQKRTLDDLELAVRCHGCWESNQFSSAESSPQSSIPTVMTAFLLHFLTHPSYFCLPSVSLMIANVVDCGVTHIKEGLGLGLAHWCKPTLRRWSADTLVQAHTEEVKCRHVGASPHWGGGSRRASSSVHACC